MIKREPRRIRKCKKCGAESMYLSDGVCPGGCMMNVSNMFNTPLPEYEGEEEEGKWLTGCPECGSSDCEGECEEELCPTCEEPIDYCCCCTECDNPDCTCYYG